MTGPDEVAALGNAAIARNGRNGAAAIEQDWPDDSQREPDDGLPPDGQDEPEVIEGMPRLWRAVDLKPATQPRWLAKGRLPRAAVSLLVGDEGIGKSLLWVWIVAAVTTGRALPEFGIPARRPSFVVLVLTEDEWSDTVCPRLVVAAADLSMVWVICTDDDGSGSPVFPRDLFLIREAHPPPSLVVVDGWLDTVAPGLSVRDPQQARQALHPWRETASTTGAAVLLLTHTNRVASANARDRYGATGALRQKARLTLFAQRGDDGVLVVGTEKANGVGETAASRFTVRPVQHFAPTAEHDGTVPLLEYMGESDQTAREHVAFAYAADHSSTGIDDVVTWLLAFLKDGKRRATTVYDAGETAGHSKDKLKRAKKRLGVETSRSGEEGAWFWSLPTSTPLLPCSLAPLPAPLSTCKESSESQREQGSTDADTPCSVCGQPMTAPESIGRGFCEECRLATSSDADR